MRKGKKSVRNLFVSLSRPAGGRQKKALMIANKQGKLAYRKGSNFFPICKMFTTAISPTAPLGLSMWSGGRDTPNYIYEGYAKSAQFGSSTE